MVYLKKKWPYEERKLETPLYKLTVTDRWIEKDTDRDTKLLLSLIGDSLGLETEVYETLGLVLVSCEVLNHAQSRSRSRFL